MPKKLTKCKQGIKYLVKEINGQKDTNLFLENIGLSVGDQITIISKLSSNYIINIKDGRFGIDEGIAKLIVVDS